MSLRRLPAAIALAIFVAMTAHVAGFGTSHALGGAHGSELTGAALAALALLLVAAVLLVAFAKPRHLTRSEATSLLVRALPGSGSLTAFAGLLAVGGVAAFAGLEALEGHDPLAAGWVLVLVPLIAVAVALLVRILVGRLADLGLRLAALAGDLNFAVPRLTMLAASAAPARPSHISRGVHRGRDSSRSA